LNNPVTLRARTKQVLKTALSISAGALDPLEELAAVKDTDRLIAWAAKLMPLRNRMAETPRSALDAAFLGNKAKASASDRSTSWLASPRRQRSDASGDRAQREDHGGTGKENNADHWSVRPLFSRKTRCCKGCHRPRSVQNSRTTPCTVRIGANQL